MSCVVLGRSKLSSNYPSPFFLRQLRLARQNTDEYDMYWSRLARWLAGYTTDRTTGWPLSSTTYQLMHWVDGWRKEIRKVDFSIIIAISCLERTCGISTSHAASIDLSTP